MRRTLRLATFALLAACSASPSTKSAPDDDFSAAAKSDWFSSKVQIVGTIAPGTSADVPYANPPLYRGLRFTVDAGTRGALVARISAPGKSPEEADPMAWLLDASGAPVAFNDDADATTADALIEARNLAPGSYTLLVRDYARRTATFRVEAQPAERPDVEVVALQIDPESPYTRVVRGFLSTGSYTTFSSLTGGFAAGPIVAVDGDTVFLQVDQGGTNGLLAINHKTAAVSTTLLSRSYWSLVRPRPPASQPQRLYGIAPAVLDDYGLYAIDEATGTETLLGVVGDKGTGWPTREPIGVDTATNELLFDRFDGNTHGLFAVSLTTGAVRRRALLTHSYASLTRLPDGDLIGVDVEPTRAPVYRISLASGEERAIADVGGTGLGFPMNGTIGVANGELYLQRDRNGVTEIVAVDVRSGVVRDITRVAASFIAMKLEQ